MSITTTDGPVSISGGDCGAVGRIQQPRRVGDGPGGSPPAGDFQDAIFTGLNDVFVADPDNRIIFHCDVPKLPEPVGIHHHATHPSAKIITEGRLVYRALTGDEWQNAFCSPRKATRMVAEETAVSKSQRHADMARLKSKPLVKSLRVDAGVMREQLDQLAALARASATAHCTSCSPMPRLRQCVATRTSSIRPREAPCELSPGRMQSCRQPTTAPSPSCATTSRIFGSRSSALERPEIGRRQRVFDPFARAAERIVRQHRHDRADVVAAGAPDGNLRKSRP